ncbi:hypothetical protein GCM10010172_11890 [Paractinoplanes ferrugineus]|uniref:Uncharacterized protein n=1 Tax=Paractinoplanes ferrugineus TaxID=113564 RepID=A0A919MBI7_9ACTN|nr:hypothetical protein Afe05nite_15930 [Actinoplanes ferrugineus]
MIEARADQSMAAIQISAASASRRLFDDGRSASGVVSWALMGLRVRGGPRVAVGRSGRVVRGHSRAGRPDRRRGTIPKWVKHPLCAFREPDPCVFARLLPGIAV